MTNKEKIALKVLADRIDELASLENCSCSTESKEEFKPYMLWFSCCAMYIREVTELSEEKIRYIKSERLNEIIRLNS